MFGVSFSRFCRYARTVVEQVLIALGIDVIAHVPAQDLTGVLSLYGSAAEVGGGKPLPMQRNGFGSGPGFIRLNFSKVRETFLVH